MIGASYPFLDVMASMLFFFLWVAFFMLLFRVIGDIFRRNDLSGLGKTGWLIFVILVPFLGDVHLPDHAERRHDGAPARCRARARQAQFDDQVRVAAASGGAAAEIESAKQLLDSGALTQTEFDALKRKALAAA